LTPWRPEKRGEISEREQKPARVHAIVHVWESACRKSNPL
jgi:hypothetical protein